MLTISSSAIFWIWRLRFCCHALLRARCSLMSVQLAYRHCCRSKWISREAHLHDPEAMLCTVNTCSSGDVMMQQGAPLGEAVCGHRRDLWQVHRLRSRGGNTSIVNVDQDQVILEDHQHFSSSCPWWMSLLVRELVYSLQLPPQNGGHGSPWGGLWGPWGSPTCSWKAQERRAAAMREAGWKERGMDRWVHGKIRTLQSRR